MRISDWSSDVCSSDLESGGAERSKAEYASYHLAADATFSQATAQTITHRTGRAEGDLASIATESKTVGTYKDRPINLIGTETKFLRRQDRQSVVQGQGVAVRVDFGCRRLITKNNNQSNNIEQHLYKN